MKAYSLIQKGLELTSIEVEISLIPGLPKFEILGLPDAMIKESEKRIRSALKLQGFKIPTGTQIIINLKPNYLRKKSRGLELAIAVLFLWKTGQVPHDSLIHLTPYSPNSSDHSADPCLLTCNHNSQNLLESPCIYGELGVDGKVYSPEDLKIYSPEGNIQILTGTTSSQFHYPTYQISELKDLASPQFVSKSHSLEAWKRPPVSHLQFSPSQAQLIEVICAGEHNTLVAGPSGSGKSYVMEQVSPFLREPQEFIKKEILKWKYLFQEDIRWRPSVHPHHSIPPISMIGGGDPILPGEITRAHGGTLLLDELLEFKNEVREALREPLTSKQISVSRRRKNVVFPANFILLSTSNLCPCGDLVPQKINSCRFSLPKCRSYSERLSGPLLDRFDILTFSHKWEKDFSITGDQLFNKLRKVYQFQKEQGRPFPNQQSESQILQDADSFYCNEILHNLRLSHRRRMSLVKVARSLADCEFSPKVQIHHFEKSLEYTVSPHEEIKKLFN